MSAQEFKVGQSISGTDYDRLPVGAKFRRGPQYSEYEVTETGFKIGMADTTLTAADYRSARRITYLPDATEPEDKDDLYVEPEPLKEGDPAEVWDQALAWVARMAQNTSAEVAIQRAEGGFNPYRAKPPQCTSLKEHDGVLVRCTGNPVERCEKHGAPFSPSVLIWTDAEEYGRVVKSGGAS